MRVLGTIRCSVSREDGIWVLCDETGWVVAADADWDNARREFEANAYVFLADIGEDEALLEDFGMICLPDKEGAKLAFTYRVE